MDQENGAPAAGAPWRIRPALAAEEEAVTGLWRACGLTVSYNDAPTDFRLARGRAGSDVLVALSPDADLAGAVMVGHDGHRGWIYYLASDPERRRAGIGTALVRAAEAWLRERGIRKLQLMVRESNEAVAGFYEAIGYERTPRLVLAKWLTA